MTNYVSQNNIAKKCGVSRMAVSLALRDSKRVSAETRKHIKQCAKRLGYNPAPYVVSLMKHLNDIRCARRVAA
jgi:DNA-binding LacI/PurR family transcriptional regulator